MSDGFWDGATAANDVDIPAFFDSSVVDGIIGLLQMGVLVSIGTTRDGGAIGLAVFDNGRRRREYFRESGDAADFLRGAVAALSSAGVGQPNGDHPPRRKPSRGA